MKLRKPFRFLLQKHSLTFCWAVSLRRHLYAVLRVCGDVRASGAVSWGQAGRFHVTCSLDYPQELAWADRLSVLSSVLSSEDRAGDVTGQRQRPVVSASLRHHVPKRESDWPRLPSAWLLPSLEEVGTLPAQPEASHSACREHCWPWIPGASGGIK